MRHGDMLDLSCKNWTNGDVVFINSTCYDDELMLKLAHLAGKCSLSMCVQCDMSLRFEFQLWTGWQAGRPAVVRVGAQSSESLPHVAWLSISPFLSELISLLSAVSMRMGTFVVTLTKRLPSQDFQICDYEMHEMSWGTATVYIQQKISESRDNYDSDDYDSENDAV